MSTSSRIQSIDFWRGTALMMIFIDHVPGNPLSHATMRNFGFADAAEAFIFLSGLVLGYITWPSIRQGKVAAVVRRCLKRSGQLYLVQVALTVSAVVLFGLAFVAGGGDGMVQDDNRAFFFAHPGSGLLGVLLLSYQIGYFNILSVYVVLMVMAAGFFVLMSRSVALAFLLSAALYALTRLGLTLPSWPVPHTWFLNPLAWQFLFLLGIGVGALRRSGPLAHSRGLFVAACGVLVFGLLVATGVFGLWPGMAGVFGPLLETDKGILGWTRLVHFLALAYVVSQIGLGDRLLTMPGGTWVAELGRHSLTIFAAGSVLSAIAQVILRLAPPSDSHPLLIAALGIGLVALGIAAMLAIARLLTRRKDRARAAAAESDGHAGTGAGRMSEGQSAG